MANGMGGGTGELARLWGNCRPVESGSLKVSLLGKTNWVPEAAGSMSPAMSSLQKRSDSKNERGGGGRGLRSIEPPRHSSSQNWRSSMLFEEGRRTRLAGGWVRGGGTRVGTAWWGFK